ncbi:DUF3995 domain-containing protein [Streptomyces sp. NPDC001928]|uniref:DUF3995 domain-containing protein n=1 Tax=Streptomyces sp. NPDC001928 TaxID=3154404 RepID=UPI00331A7DC4
MVSSIQRCMEGGDAMKTAGRAAAIGLAAAGFMHVIWVFSPWPLASRSDYARIVVGVSEADLPSAPLTAAAAAALLLAAYLVAARAGVSQAVLPGWMIRIGPWLVATVLLMRGLGGFLVSALDLIGAPAEYTHWDLQLYSPVCVLLGGLSAWVAARERWREGQLRHAEEGA